MRNVAGLRVPPGNTDKGTIGATFNVAMAEDDDATRDLGSPSLRVDRGFLDEQDVVTVQSVVSISPPVYTGSEDPETQLEMLAHFLARPVGRGPSRGTSTESGRRCFGHAWIEVRWLEMYPHYVGAGTMDLPTQIAAGNLPSAYSQSSDPHRRVPMLLRLEWTNIVVARDPGRNQSRFYVNNHEQGFPVSKPVAYRDS
jgi:hypothetical protein